MTANTVSAALLIRYTPPVPPCVQWARHYAAERMRTPPHMLRVFTETATPLRPPTCLWTVA
jgi:hypothetical protein